VSTAIFSTRTTKITPATNQGFAVAKNSAIADFLYS
jgi:hypothetical protein